jgi:hypothetical protein
MQRLTSVVFLSLFFVSSLFAQPLKPGEWRAYTSMRSIRAMALAPDSIHAWAATEGGVFRINLRDSEATLALRTTDGLSENDLWSVATDNDGNAYVGGKGGGFDLIRQNGTVEKLGADIRSRQDLTPKKIFNISIQGDTIFLATGYGLEIYRKSARYFPSTVFQLGTDVPRQDSVRQTVVYRGYLFAAMREGVAYASLRNDVSIPANWSLIQDTALGATLSLAIFNDRLCVGTTKGLFTYSESDRSLTRVSFDTGVDRLCTSAGSLYLLDVAHNVSATSDLQSFRSIAPNTVSTVSALGAAPESIGILFGTQKNGIAYALGSVPRTDIYPPGPINNDVNDLHFAPSEHELFFVSGPNGFGSFKTDRSEWKNFTPEATLGYSTTFDRVFYDTVRSLLWLVSQGRLYAARNYGPGPLVVDTVKRIESNLPSTVSPTAEYFRAGKPMLSASGDFVIPTWANDGGKGLSILDRGTQYHFTNYEIIDPQSWAAWGCVTQDLEGNFWVGGMYGSNSPPNAGLSWHNMADNTYGNIPGPPQGSLLLHNSVNAIATDPDDEIWCGTSAGLQILSDPYAIHDKNPKFYFRSVKLLERQVVRSIATDGVGNKWIGTEEGIFVVSPDGSDSVARFTKSNSPLIDDVIASIVIDPALGEAYAATPSGISRFSTIFKQGGVDYSGIRAYPNPVVQTTEESPKVYIDGLMAGSTVKIFSLNMKLVKSINGTTLGSTVVWDGRDDIGRQVPSGEYLISATTTESGEHGAAKVVIIRK